MAYSHTNSKGTTYYLHSNGKMFYFSKEIKEGVLEAVPAGYNVVDEDGYARLEAKCPTRRGYAREDGAVTKV